jgi:hypothetical protein
MTRSSFPTRAGASLAAACALVAVAAFGQTLPAATVLGDYQRLRAHYELVAEVRLKAVYLHCARESSQRLLGFDEAARCSIASEVLKMRSFRGDFNALLAWWRQHRDDRIDEPFDAGDPTERMAAW